MPTNDNDISVVYTYLMCESCRFVDRDSGREEPGYICPRCKQPSGDGLEFLNLNASVAIRLIRQAWRERRSATETRRPDLDFTARHVRQIWKDLPPAAETRQSDSELTDLELRLITFYCMLQEILMEDFLWSSMAVTGVPVKLIERTLRDNWSISKREDSLFPAVTGTKFREKIRSVVSNSEVATRLLDVWKRAIDARNKFIHGGGSWSIPDQIDHLAESCWGNVIPLCNAFVGLHNQYAIKGISD